MERLDLPTNEAEAREVLEVTIKQIIVENYTPNSTPKLNATKAASEITDVFIKAYRALKQNGEGQTVDNK